MAGIQIAPKRSKRQYRNDLTAEFVRSLLDYDPKTGIFRWKVQHGGMNNRDVAGHLNPKGYIQISINYRLYRAHRLAFLVTTGNWPKGDIDHKNRIKHDNRLENIRPASQSNNLANQLGSPGRRKSKFKGVYKIAERNTGKIWIAEIRVNNQRIRLGRFEREEDAYMAYMAAAKKYFGQFARGHVRS